MPTDAQWEQKNLETAKQISWGQAWNLAVEIMIPHSKNYKDFGEVDNMAKQIYPYLRAGAPDKVEGEFMSPQEFAIYYGRTARGEDMPVEEYDPDRFAPWMADINKEHNKEFSRDNRKGDHRLDVNIKEKQNE